MHSLGLTPSDAAPQSLAIYCYLYQLSIHRHAGHRHAGHRHAGHRHAGEEAAHRLLELLRVQPFSQYPAVSGAVRRLGAPQPQRFGQCFLPVPHPFRDAGQPVFPGQFGQHHKYQDVDQLVAQTTGVPPVFQAAQKIIQAAHIHHEPLGVALPWRIYNIDIKPCRTILHHGLPPSDRA